MITQAELKQTITRLGLAGRCVCIHSSLRAFGQPLEGGADGLIDAFLGCGCTLMAPAFCYDHETTPPEHAFLPQNGMEPSDASAIAPSEKIFSPRSIEMTTAELGTLPLVMLKRPGRTRSNHKLNSFVALGPKAQALLAGQTDQDVFAPFRALCAQGGFVLLLGTGLQGCTLLHYGEFLAGRRPFVRWANDSQHRPVAVRIGSCSLGFDAFEPVASPLEHTATLGQSRWRCFSAPALAQAAAQAIRNSPTITQCGRPTCLRCRDAVLGGPMDGPAQGAISI